MTHGVTILANYTWSKSIDDLPPGGGVNDIGADSVSARPWDDPLRHQFDRGPSDFDRKHNFAASFIWQLPRLSKSNILARSILGDWQLGGIVSARTGRPLTIVSGTNRSGTGIGQDRAKLAGAALGPGSCAAAGITTVPCKDWLNPLAFTQADLNTFGNVGKGSIRFPGFYAWDMSLSKTFSFKDQWKVQLRGEFFNLFNRVNFLSDDGTVGPASNFAKVSSTSSFGAITTATDPRIGQLALKLIF